MYFKICPFIPLQSFKHEPIIINFFGGNMSKCPSISGKKTPGPAHRMFSSLNKKQILFITDYLKKMSQRYFSMQHLSRRHLSISGISRRVLTQFWPNFWNLNFCINISAVADPVLTKLLGAKWRGPQIWRWPKKWRLTQKWRRPQIWRQLQKQRLPENMKTTTEM